jgi:hypothetical protein
LPRTHTCSIHHWIKVLEDSDGFHERQDQEDTAEMGKKRKEKKFLKSRIPEFIIKTMNVETQSSFHDSSKGILHF